MSDPNSTHPDRRTFLQIAGAIVGASVSGASTEASPAAVPQAAGTLSAGFAAPPIPEVRVGFVGVGGQGGAHVRNMLAIPGVRVTAVCDIAEERVKLMQKLVVAAGQKEPTGYSRGPRDFERLCETEDVDLVFTATPWEWHVPVVRRRHEERQACRDRSAGGDDPRRLLGSSSSTRRSTRSTA